MSNSYYNDKKKLADAIALARSFSRAKPVKSRDNSRPPSQSYGAGQLRSAARQQLTQSVVRLGSLNPAAKISHRQLPQSFQTRRQAPMSMAAWQSQKDVPSITGGRGLDFLNRRDDTTAVAVQPKVTSMPAMPPVLPNPGQSRPMSTAPAAPTAAPTRSVLDEFFALMAQHEKEMAQVDPLVDKLQQWNLRSPVATKSRAVGPSATPVSQPAMSKAVFEPMTAMPLGEVSNLPQTLRPDIGSGSLFESTNISVRLPPTPQQEDNSRPMQVTEQLVVAPQTPKPSQGNVAQASKPRNGLTASHFASNETEDFIPQQQQMSRVAFGAIEQLVRPPQTLGPARCNCSPTIKPQKGLAASRFASPKTESSPFANKFSVNLQIAVHQEFCPLSDQNRSKTKGIETEKVPKALRAEAEPFTPRR